MKTVALLAFAFSGSSLFPRMESLYQSLLMKKVARREKITTVAALGNQERIFGIFSKNDCIKDPAVAPNLEPTFWILARMVSFCPVSRLLNILVS
ncbi:Uncharacterised protein [Mycobacteroides abscessus subsp. abscessus]|nr:Uncharacterised protein [Mycobacteroides abscessus subsp. abscessus]